MKERGEKGRRREERRREVLMCDNGADVCFAAQSVKFRHFQ